MTSRSRLVVLGEITRALSRGDSPDEVIRVALEAVQKALAADVVSFASTVGTTLRFIILEGEEINASTFPRDAEGLSETVLESGEPAHIHDLTESEVRFRRLLGGDSPHARSYVGVPAMSGSRVVGVLSVQSYQPGAFVAGDVDLIAQVGRQVADAVVSSRRVARIQRRLNDLDRTQRERTDFLVGVAHDMRSPLAGIIGFARILEELEVVDTDPMALEAVQFIAAESQRLSDLVAELVDLGRVDLGEASLEIESLDLRRLVEQAIDSVRPRFPAHRFVLRGEGVPVEADLVRLHRVVVNLLENAATHGPPGGLVTVEVERSGDEAIVAVCDRGTGVPRNDRERIFERFVRLDGSIAGSGIGLYVVRALVEAHGGSISVGDAPGGGARFAIRLPVGSVMDPHPVP